MSEITSPIMLDDTGQDLVTEAQNIVTKLQALINAVKPDAADIPLAAISGMTADDVQEGIEELKSNLVNITTYPTDSTEYVVGMRRGKPLYRKYIHKTGVQIATNTDYAVTGTGDLPSDATNVTVCDKSFIGSGSMKLPANCQYSIFYSVGHDIKWRQGWSSSTVWEIWLWAEYEKNTD